MTSFRPRTGTDQAPLVSRSRTSTRIPASARALASAAPAKPPPTRMMSCSMSCLLIRLLMLSSLPVPSDITFLQQPCPRRASRMLAVSVLHARRGMDSPHDPVPSESCSERRTQNSVSGLRRSRRRRHHAASVHSSFVGQRSYVRCSLRRWENSSGTPRRFPLPTRREQARLHRRERPVLPAVAHIFSIDPHPTQELLRSPTAREGLVPRHP